MRVLHIGKYYPPYSGGIENFFRDLIRALSRAGVSVSALVHHHDRGRGPSIERDDGFTVLRAPCRGQAVYVPVSPAFPCHLAGCIRRFRPDILHFHFPNPSSFWALALPEARRIPWVIHWHADAVPSNIDRRLRALYRPYRPFEQAFLARAERVIPTTRAYLEASEALRPWRRKCTPLPLGLDPERMPDPAAADAAKAEGMWPPGAFRVLAVGRLTYYKGIRFLIRAAGIVKTASVLVVGNGPLRGGLKREIVEIGLQERVVLAGSVPDTELRALLAGCDCLCLPSIERSEAFGLVLIEAMRYRKAIVASDIPGSGVGWVLGKGSCGILASPSDEASLARALLKLAEDPALRDKLGKSGYQAFQRWFHISTVARSMMDVYSEILSARKGIRLKVEGIR